MQISLTQSELEVGIKMYIQSRGIALSNRDINMDFTSTRKGNSGVNVEVDLGEDAVYVPTHVSTPVVSAPAVTVTANQSGGFSAKRSPKPVFEVVDMAEPETKVEVAPTPEPVVEAVKQPEPEPKPEVKEAPAVKEEVAEAAPVEEAKPEVKEEPAQVPVRANPFATLESDTPEETPQQRSSIFS